MVRFVTSFVVHVLRSVGLAPNYVVATDGNQFPATWSARRAVQWAEREVFSGRAKYAYVGVANWFDRARDWHDDWHGLVNVFTVIRTFGDDRTGPEGQE